MNASRNKPGWYASLSNDFSRPRYPNRYLASTIMKHHILIAAILVTAFVALTYYASTSSAGSSFAHKVNGMFFTLASTALALGSAISTVVFWRRTVSYRNYSILLFALSCSMLIGLSCYRANQSAIVIETLESTYNSIANDGAPFPTESEIHKQYLEKLPDSYSTGYWVSPDRQTFEIYYHDSSDSYTMRFPNGNWDWRGNEYTGPEIAR